MNGFTTTLLLEVFTQRNFVADVIRLNLNFIHKNDNSLFEPPFGGVRGNVGNSSIACRKVRYRLPIRDNWTFFASCYGLDVISRYWPKSAFSKGEWVTLNANFRWKETSSTNLCWCQKTTVITLSCNIKISAVYSFIWSHQTDRITISKTALA